MELRAVTVHQRVSASFVDLRFNLIDHFEPSGRIVIRAGELFTVNGRDLIQKYPWV